MPLSCLGTSKILRSFLKRPQHRSITEGKGPRRTPNPTSCNNSSDPKTKEAYVSNDLFTRTSIIKHHIASVRRHHYTHSTTIKQPVACIRTCLKMGVQTSVPRITSAGHLCQHRHRCICGRRCCACRNGSPRRRRCRRRCSECRCPGSSGGMLAEKQVGL